jgi:predicted protein tyrosine phosphatase
MAGIFHDMGHVTLPRPPMTNALFICGKARMRSPTAADLAAAWPGIATDFAGLSHDADERVSLEHLEWADIIFVMETRQARRLRTLYPAALRHKRVVILNIPDRYGYGDPTLIALLEPRLRAALARNDDHDARHTRSGFTPTPDPFVKND